MNEWICSRSLPGVPDAVESSGAGNPPQKCFFDSPSETNIHASMGALLPV